ncbi:MAG: hypothetical protein KU38_06065 [Sulfurovum sp. FS08-3]|nr:MAG: hypothetical protein KU38_06065 [Sulfurovum sp. FS08-3]
MKALIEIHEHYTSQFEHCIQTLPKGVVKITPIKNALDIEMDKRVGEIQTKPLNALSSIRERYVRP